MNNIYNTVLVSPNTPTVVNGVTVPTRGSYSFKGLIIWCEADTRVDIKLNVDTIGGGRISGSVQTLFLDYSASPYGLQAGDIVTVLATQTDSPDPWAVSSTLLVEQL